MSRNVKNVLEAVKEIFLANENTGDYTTNFVSVINEKVRKINDKRVKVIFNEITPCGVKFSYSRVKYMWCKFTPDRLFWDYTWHFRFPKMVKKNNQCHLIEYKESEIA